VTLRNCMLENRDSVVFWHSKIENSPKNLQLGLVRGQYIFEELLCRPDVRLSSEQLRGL
jgi:hypothetical protein